MVTNKMSEDTPTDVTALKPVANPTSVVIPKASALPSMEAEMTPNPDSYLEQAVYQVLAGMRRLNNVETTIDDMLERAIHRIGIDAAERETNRARTVDANLEMIRNEVRGLRVTLDQLIPRVSGTETGIESIRIDMRQLRSEFENKNHELEQRLALMDQAIQDAQMAAIKHLTAPGQV